MLRAWHKLRNFSSMPPRQPLIAIVGSTGTGKSDVHLTILSVLVRHHELTTTAS
jgi:ABC-type glutathione transport system ATPase component